MYPAGLRLSSSAGDADELNLSPSRTISRLVAPLFGERSGKVGSWLMGTPCASGSPASNQSTVAGRATVSNDHFVGTLLDGRYRVVSLIGSGGVADVYRGEQAN